MSQFRRQSEKAAIVSIALLFGWTHWHLAAVHAEPPATDDAPKFEQGVQALLKAKCGSCHGANQRKADLDLTTLAGIRRGGESGESLLPAEGGETTELGLLWTKIEAGEMPPDGAAPLTDSERRLLKRWLTSGPDRWAAEPDVVTQHDVLPILLLRCAACHGAQVREADLDLRSIAGLRTGSKRGEVVTPKSPDRSLLIQRIESQQCPPTELLLKFFVRRPTNEETRTLRDWIEQGAREFPMAPDVATTAPDPLVNDQDRDHWAFQPPEPSMRHDSVDGWIHERLQKAGLAFSEEAGADTLIRRVHIDLTGLPPTRSQWQRWKLVSSNSSPGKEAEAGAWYGKMVDELLESPHYGERWGRHWLDIAGYADSEGGISADPIRKVAWRYRDYVVRSFNNNKPYDRFLLEQLAGDELVDFANVSPEQVTSEMVDNLIATGFLRMGVDQTGSRTMNFVPERLGVIDDAINVIGSGLMGLTLQCARCHSHKYDPLPQRDYYRMKAILQGAMDEHDWLSFKTRVVRFGSQQQREQVAKANPPLLKTIRALQRKQKAAEAELQLALLRAHYPDQPESDRQRTIDALKIADNNRTLPHRRLVEMLQTAEAIAPSRQPEPVQEEIANVRSIRDAIIATQRKLVTPLEIRALWDRGQPSPTYLLARGEHHRPGRWIGPGVPSVLTDGKTPFTIEPVQKSNGDGSTGRRLAFAKWLTQPRHPLTARVYVNRVWSRHFGKGLVKTLENLGIQGAEPSHPELLDWLAADFADHGWDIKRLHRMLLLSRTYRQSSVVSDHAHALDPENRLLSRMPLKRLDAESVRDALLLHSGRLETRMGGPPDPVETNHEGAVLVIPQPDGRQRRSLYVQHRRTELPSLLTTFDYPKMGPNCVQRNKSTVSPQALMLLNDRDVRALADAMAKQVWSELSEAGSPSSGQLIQHCHEALFARTPTPHERDELVRSFESMQHHWRRLADGEAKQKSLATLCHAFLNSAAFVYVD